LTTLLFFLLSQVISPADSCWKLVELGIIPDRAVLFAEAASREGGAGGMDLAVLLELSGRFEDAVRCYGIIGNTSNDSDLVRWIEGRESGCTVLDTLVILRAMVTNRSCTEARDITVEIPRPESHGPYQTLIVKAGILKPYGEVLRFHICSLDPGDTLILPVVLAIRQEPYSFRPFSEESLNLPISIEEMAEMARAVDVADCDSGRGPCLQAAESLRDLGMESGLDLRVVGGLFRDSSGDLLFHAWNHLEGSGFPIDALLFQQDSLRGIGHCTTDLIPLWDYDVTGGHEVSVFYPTQEAELSVSMDAVLSSSDDVMWILDICPFITSGYP